MGKGDRRTCRGKIFVGSYGNSRPHVSLSRQKLLKKKDKHEQNAKPTKS